MYQVLVPVHRDANRSYHRAKHVDRLAEDGGDLEVTVLHVGDEAFDQVDAVEAADMFEDGGVAVERVVTVTG
jgi:hypothetical protein